MSLKTQKGSSLPEGAVPLSSKDALKYQWTLIRNWPSEVEVLSLKFGRNIASAATFFSSFYVINFFKKTLNVGSMRFFITVLPGAGLPSVLSHYFTDQIMTNSVLLMKLSCPLCDQLYFTLSQFYLGVIFPAFYGYLSLSAFACITKSYPVPNLATEAREYGKFTLQILKKGTPHYQVAGLVQTVVILFLPYFQNKQLINVMNKSYQNN